MNRTYGERAVAVAIGAVVAAMPSAGLVGCASSPKTQISKDASHDGPITTLCSGPAAGALIDDMSGSSISLAPPSCASSGAWFAFTGGDDSSAPGSLTVPAAPAASSYSPLPAAFPGLDGSTVDGGSSGLRAMCMAGHTGARQYAYAAADLFFANGDTNASALIDASGYSGMQFWLWVSPDTAASVSSSFSVGLYDKNGIPEGGVCDANSTGPTACASTSAAISGSVVATDGAGSGALLADDGSQLPSLSAGWQHVRAPWSSFLPNPWWGGANEQMVDPRTLVEANFVVSQTVQGGAAIPFDYCIYQVSFLP
jgi:hypothetical protein